MIRKNNLFKHYVVDQTRTTKAALTMTLIVPLCILIGTGFIGFTFYFGSDTKWLVRTSSLTAQASADQKVKFVCLAEGGCWVSSAWRRAPANLPAKDDTAGNNGASTTGLGKKSNKGKSSASNTEEQKCKQQACTKYKQRDTIELTMCYSPDPIDGVSITWLIPDEDKGKGAGIGAKLYGFLFDDETATLKKYGTDVASGQQILFHTKYSIFNHSWSTTPEEFRSWDVLTTSPIGIFQEDEINTIQCLKDLVNVDKDNLLTSTASKFRSAKLRMAPTITHVVVYQEPPLAFASAVGGLITVIMLFGRGAISCSGLCCKSNRNQKSQQTTTTMQQSTASRSPEGNETVDTESIELTENPQWPRVERGGAGGGGIMGWGRRDK